ncbi:MAG: hypothetical protein JXN64_10135 [Spirochaetes bacterium]|nr:hypothetical protein [Spirochaetota bacterium]
MNKKILTTLVLILTIYISFIFTGCNKPDDEDTAVLKIYIKNESTSTLKHIYWMSDVFSGVLDIEVPKSTEQYIDVDSWPGKIFQLMITTSDTDQYIKWKDVQSDSDPDALYVGMLNFDVKLFESCELEAYFVGLDGVSTSYPYSVENTLPSMP